MAIVALFDFPGEPIENYDEALERDRDAKRHQPERTVHVCFQTEDGWAVVDVWASKEAFAAFSDVLGLPPDRQPRVYEVHNQM